MAGVKPDGSTYLNAWMGDFTGGVWVDENADQNLTLGASHTPVFDRYLQRNVVRFDNLRLETTGMTAIPVADFVIGGWFRLQRDKTIRSQFFSFNRTAPYTTIGFWGTTTQIRFTCGTGGAELTDQTLSGGRTVYDWHHAMIRYQHAGPKQAECFLNGKLVSTFSTAGAGVADSYNDNIGGSRNTSHPFNGFMADMIIASALTNDEIAWLADPRNGDYRIAKTAIGPPMNTSHKVTAV